MTFKVCLAFALVGFALVESIPQGYSVPQPARQPTYGAPQTKAPAKYDFDWAVNDPASGNDFGHQESRDGDYTQGSYYVLLPDGRLQRVNYNVQGDSGFVAEVTYEGEARTYTPPQPSYAPPPSNYAGK
ncbi:pro-resilin-like [Oratosquilla oratoria]|uniref:pro-resilin-like n=1 Tax=Oratosquilla oratoria TaxID=337810 RepID=UPI003F776179